MAANYFVHLSTVMWITCTGLHTAAVLCRLSGLYRMISHYHILWSCKYRYRANLKSVRGRNSQLKYENKRYLVVDRALWLCLPTFWRTPAVGNYVAIAALFRPLTNGALSVTIYTIHAHSTELTLRERLFVSVFGNEPYLKMDVKKFGDSLP